MNASGFSNSLLNEARAAAASQAKAMVDMLFEIAALPAADFLAQLSRTFDVPAVTLSHLVPEQVDLTQISYVEAFRRQCMAIRDGTVLRVVVVDPFDAEVFAWAESVVTEPFGFALMQRDEFAALLAMLESKLGAASAGGSAEQVVAADSSVEDITLLTLAAETNQVVKALNSSIFEAMRLQASDIHLESDASGLTVKLRVDGVLIPAGRNDSIAHAEQIVSRVKVLAELDIGERRIPQDGRFKVRVNGMEIDMRVSVMPSIFGEDVVLRLLDRRSVTAMSSALTLDSLGFDALRVRMLRRLSRRAHGMLLVTGPTGSGKTTTLYAALSEINVGSDKIITIEDPVEYRLPGVLQIPVNEKKGLTFARGLRSILRHDPDKIMVGEVRDSETAEIAVQSALTGHLVFTTVHANNAFDVVGRLLQMGVDSYSLAAALNGIVAQRLVRQVCAGCAEPHIPDDEELYGCDLRREDISGWTLVTGRGCAQCRGSGYRGRKAVAEVLMLNDRLRELISMKAPVTQLRIEAENLQFVPLRTEALALAAKGVTTLLEVGRAVF
jgi:general secretion pathway protein E